MAASCRRPPCILCHSHSDVHSHHRAPRGPHRQAAGRKNHFLSAPSKSNPNKARRRLLNPERRLNVCVGICEGSHVKASFYMSSDLSLNRNELYLSAMTRKIHPGFRDRPEHFSACVTIHLSVAAATPLTMQSACISDCKRSSAVKF